MNDLKIKDFRLRLGIAIVMLVVSLAAIPILCQFAMLLYLIVAF